jgi:hypothetical protein
MTKNILVLAFGENELGETSLIQAVVSGSWASRGGFTALESRGGLATDSNGNITACVSGWHGASKVLNTLGALGADLQLESLLEFTPLHLAVARDHLNAARVPVKGGQRCCQRRQHTPISGCFLLAWFCELREAAGDSITDPSVPAVT